MKHRVLFPAMIFFVIAGFAGIARAQFYQSSDSLMLDEKYINAHFNNAMGMEYASLTGYGIFYKRSLTDKLFLKVTGVPYYFENNSTKQLIYNIGFQTQMDFAQLRLMRGYMLVGGAYSYNNLERNIEDYNNYSKLYSDLNKGFSLGMGFGFEARLFQQLIMHGEITGGFKSTERSGPSNDFERLMSVGFGLGVGMVF